MTTLEKIKAEIRKMLDRERDFTSENARVQALALVWVLELIDKYAEQEPLTEEDYKELHDRFGDYVEFVVRDMVSGTGERWTKAGDKKMTTVDKIRTEIEQHKNDKFNCISINDVLKIIDKYTKGESK